MNHAGVNRESRENDAIAAKTQAFWNAHPCDGQDTFEALLAYRHAKEPWLPLLLGKVAASEREVVEVGCGQGTDGIYMCRLLPAGARYIGLDQSNVSVANAVSFAEETRHSLKVTPQFRVGDARHLPFDDGSVGAVYSMGVLHHIQNTEGTIREVHRVLRPGGALYLGLYSTLSAKLLAAHAARAVQSALDWVTGEDRIVLKRLLSTRFGSRTGTMLHECFGVPILKSYTSHQMRRVLRDFEVTSLASFGSGNATVRGFGYLWVAIARKPR